MADTRVVEFLYVLGLYLLILVVVVLDFMLAKLVVDDIVYVSTTHEEDQPEEDQREEESLGAHYVPPVLKELSPEQIADIHARGKVTPAEYVDQWESTGTCWVISEGLAAPFCEHFRNCHDCLVAMANRADEYTSLWDYLKPYNFDI